MAARFRPRRGHPVQRSFDDYQNHFRTWSQHGQPPRYRQNDAGPGHYYAAAHQVAQLHPLPVRGLFYRWSVDLCGDFIQTEQGNSYLMICIEHFSKWVEIIPIPDKRSSTIASAFLLHVLSRFLAPAEVLTDQGREFQGEFEVLLRQANIDHRTTSREYPQADGLAERMVQVLKVQLQKYCLEKNPTTWDDQVPWIAMGYRATKHASLLNYSPYFLLYGREPLFTPRVRAQLEPPLDLDNADTWFQTILRRSRIFETVMPIAMNNLAIAQHRDTLRYAHTRSGLYSPRNYEFKKGDYVYIRRNCRYLRRSYFTHHLTGQKA